MTTSPNQLYQYSILDALMQGITQGGTTITQILSHGDHGLGTLSGLDGEIIILDGEVYHFPPDGELRKVECTDQMPFVMTTRFEPTMIKHLDAINSSTLSRSLSPFLPSKQNCFLSIRVDAFFRNVTYRVIPKQSKPGESLADLAKRQVLRSICDLEGTLFGFWSPGFTNGLSVKGFHLHFLSADRRNGGHVIDFQAETVTLSAAMIDRYLVHIPDSDEFNQHPIEGSSAEDLHQAEGK